MIYCPNCGKSHYVIHYSTATAMGWVLEYQDGKLLNKDPNITTVYCTCCEYHHDFSYQMKYGEVINLTDNGEKIDPVIEDTINNLVDDAPSTINIQPESNEIHFQWEVDLEEIKKEIGELKQQIGELYVKLSH